MAKARRVVADQNSQELDELRRQFNNLLAIVTGAADFAAVKAAVVAGVDSTTGREILGVRPSPTHPRRPKTDEIEDLGSDY